MEGLVYLSVRVGCAAYLLYKVWEQKKKVRELCDLLYTPAKREQMISMSPESADEKEVMGKTRFVYLDENAGKTAAPYMSQPLEQGTDYIGEDEEIREEDVECLLPLEEMELLRKEQEELDSALPETEVITQAVTLEELYTVTFDGQPAGYAVKLTASGSQGLIEMVIGVDAEQKITGISVVNHSETSGIGTKVCGNKPNDDGVPVLDQFVGMSGAGTLKVGKTVTAISGATVSTKGVTKGANAALAAVAALG